MAKSFEFTVWGDSLNDWLTAAGLAMAGRSTALILGHALDREAGVFPEAPVDFSGSEIIANHFGEAPAGGAEAPWVPDLQVVWPELRLDLFADPAEFQLGLERDLPGHAPSVLAASAALRQLAEKIERQFLAQPGYPPLTWIEKIPAALKGLPRAIPEIRRPLSELLEAHGLPAPLHWLFLLPLKALSPGLPDHPNLGSAALLWYFLLRQKRGVGPAADLRLRLRDLIQQNGKVYEAKPERVTLAKDLIAGIQLSSKTELEPGLVIAEPGAIFAVLDPDQREDRVGRKLALLFPRSVQHTFFFRVERSALPETMARRVVVLNDPRRPLAGANFLGLCRIPRVPRWETLAVTATYPKGDVPPPAPEELVRALEWLLPFLGRDQIAPDETRPVVSRNHYAPPHPTSLWPASPRTPARNLYLPADQVLSGIGPQAAFLFAGALNRRYAKMKK
jgi:hypothetical protein